MQLVVELKNHLLLNKIDDREIYGYILSINELSAYNDTAYSINELEEIINLIHQKNKKVYLNVRRIFHEDDFELMEDVEVENNQAIEMCSIYRDILTNMIDANASIISNNLNTVMKV